MLSEGMPLSFAWRQFNTRDQYSHALPQSHNVTQLCPQMAGKLVTITQSLLPQKKSVMERSIQVQN